MIFNTPALDATELAVVARIEELKKTLGYLIGTTPKRWPGLLRRNAFARAIRGSNSIEGYNVTVEDAIAAAAGEEPLEASSEAWAAVVGYRSAMTYVLQLADDPHFAYSADLMRALHFMMMQHDLPKNPGKWRPGPIFVRNDDRKEIVYEGPPAEQIAPLVEELVTSLRAGDNIPGVVRAAMAHLNLVMIHPFSDGNGRMARCLQTLVLARTGILAPQFSSIEEYLGRNTLEYYDVLAKVGEGRWQPQRDALPWIRFCLTAHFRQATTLLRRSEEVNRLWDAIEIEVDRLGLDTRVVVALADAALMLKVRNATYRVAAEVSDQLASRDLKDLVTAGFLEPKGERRGRYYLASPRLREIRRATAYDRQKKVPDPFDDVVVDEMPYLPGLEKFETAEATNRLTD